MTRLRGPLALVALAATAVYLAKDFAPREIRARWVPANAAASGVDPEYARFLEAVAAATPRDATVCVLGGSTASGAGFGAAYFLAPRRVVGAEGWDRAPYVAVYRRRNAPPPAGAAAMPGGFLQKK